MVVGHFSCNDFEDSERPSNRLLTRPYRIAFSSKSKAEKCLGDIPGRNV